MTNVLPTIVLVHGAWHTPANYSKFSNALTKAGFTVHCPRLPSCNNISLPPASFTEDVDAVRAVVQQYVEAGERVLMVMHSYGGMVGTDAVTNDLLRSTRAAAGRPGGVIHLLYQCAYVLEPGTSIIDISKASGLFGYWPQFVNNYDDGSTFPVDPATLFLNDVDPEIVEGALPHLVRSPLSAFNAVPTGDCWKKLPVTYVHTHQDGSVPYVYQSIMIERAEKHGVVIEKESYETCHSVFITKEEEMVELALKAAKDKRNSESADEAPLRPGQVK